MADENSKSAQLPPRSIRFMASRSEPFTRRRAELNQEWQFYLEEYRDISDHFQVRRGRYLMEENRKPRKRTAAEKLLHEEGQFCSRVLGAGMLAGVSSPARPWLKLTTPDKELNEFKSARAWLDDLQTRTYQIFAASNYYHVKQQSYRDMGDFGQGPTIIDEDFEDGINCYCSPPGEYRMAVDRRGVVDTLYRDMRKTTLQLVNQFGRDVPIEVMQSYDRSDNDKTWDITHICEPNFMQVQGERGPRGMPYLNAYIALGCSTAEGNDVMMVRGYNRNPISAPRWDVQPGDIYGFGCGALAIGAVRSLQVLEKRNGQIVDKLALPPLQAPTSLEGKAINHMPGKVSYYPDQMSNQGQSGPISPLYKVDPAALPAMLNEDSRLVERTRRAYFVDLFLQLSMSDRREVTAREVEEKHEEKLIQLGPVLERTHYEGLNRDVRRVVDVVVRNRLVPPPPPELDGIELKIEYTSILAVAQRAVGVGAIERLAGFVGNLSAANPDILDKMDFDQAVDEYSEAIGTPSIIVRSDEDVAKIRDARAKQKQQQQALATASVGADTAKVLSEADTGRDSNLLADILGGQGRLV